MSGDAVTRRAVLVGLASATAGGMVMAFVPPVALVSAAAIPASGILAALAVALAWAAEAVWSGRRLGLPVTAFVSGAGLTLALMIAGDVS